MQRLAITARLEDTIAHVVDAESRVSAHLWRLTTALECLDLAAVRRHRRALDLLAAETGAARVRFFAASRRGMYALLTGDLEAAERARRETAAAGEEAGEPDTVAGHPGAQAADGGLGAVLDQQALSAYRHRLAELDADLGGARSWADAGRAAKLAAERDALLDQLRAAAGLGGRARQPGSDRERARIAVRKAIASAIGRVSAVDPSLGRLLSANVTTGTICRYDPDPDRPVR